MKKAISILCIISLLIGVIPLNVLALDTEKPQSLAETILVDSGLAEECSSQLVNVIEDDLSDLSYFGIHSDKVKIEDIKNGVISYSYPITDNVTDVYIVTKQADGSIILDITEGNLKDRIIKQADGKTLINGVNYGAEPLRMSNTDYSKSPFGKVTDYVSYVGTTSNSNVELSKTIISFTITALCTLIGTLLGMPTEFTDLMADLAQQVLHAANEGNPTSKYLSYSQRKYKRVDSMPTDSYFRYIADCYPAANYGGNVSQEIYYQHSYFT